MCVCILGNAIVRSTDMTVISFSFGYDMITLAKMSSVDIDALTYITINKHYRLLSLTYIN